MVFAYWKEGGGVAEKRFAPLGGKTFGAQGEPRKKGFIFKKETCTLLN
jgi:hypothetical protein